MLGTVLRVMGVTASWIQPICDLVHSVRKGNWRRAKAQLILMANDAEKLAFEQEMGFGPGSGK